MAWLDETALQRMGFAHIGINVQLSDCATYYGCNRIRLGNNVRIDDFCILSAGVGGIELGSYVHIAAYSSLIGAGKITLSNFAGLSSRVSIYSSNDDYSGAFLTNPTVPAAYTNVSHADVFLGEHTIIGVGSVILPGVRLERGAAVGSLSLVSRDCEPFWIYSGVPAHKIKPRDQGLLQKEIELLIALNTNQLAT